MRSALHKILDARDDIAPNTRLACERAIDKFIAYAGADPSAWTPAIGQAFYEHLCMTGMRNGARTTMGHLRYVAHWHAHQTGAPDFTIVRMRRRVEPEARIALTPEEAIAWLATCDRTIVGCRDWTIFVLGLETGMRAVSLRGLACENITHHIRGYPVAVVPVKGPGGTATYSVPLSNLAVRVLEHFRAGVGRGPAFVAFKQSIGARGQTKLTPSKTPLSHQAIYKLITARAERAGLRHLHPHLLRHTFITWRATAGVPMHHIAAITGHNVEAQLSRAPKWGELPTYLDETAVADEARNTSPAWLVELVNNRLR